MTYAPRVIACEDNSCRCADCGGRLSEDEIAAGREMCFGCYAFHESGEAEP